MPLFKQKAPLVLKDTSSTRIAQAETDSPSKLASFSAWVAKRAKPPDENNEDFVVISRRLSIDHPVNFDTLSPWEKIYAGAMSAYKRTQMYQHFEQQKQSQELARQHARKIAALSAIATILQTCDLTDPRGKPVARQIVIPPDNQFAISELPSYFPEWKVSIIPANSQVNSLCPLPTLVKFERRLL